MDYKRLTLLCGHYGSGKTNIAVNMAMELREKHERVAVADLDIVNPYFRTKDSAGEFTHAGIRLICSEYANSNVDIPSMPQDLYVITDDKDLYTVIDVGGDDRGALALGRIAPAILEENDYEMLAVINKYRPLTPDAASTVEVLREIEYACGMRFTGLLNNSNLGYETTAETVLSSLPYAEDVSSLMGIPVVASCAESGVCGELCGKTDKLFELKLQKKII